MSPLLVAIMLEKARDAHSAVDESRHLIKIRIRNRNNAPSLRMSVVIKTYGILGREPILV